MSKIDELIQRLCPDGVGYKKLEELEDSGIIALGRGKVIARKIFKTTQTNTQYIQALQ